MIDRNGKTVVPFAPSAKDGLQEASDVDRSGQEIIALLTEAAETAKSTCERALETAQKFSVQLRASEGRVRDLEADLQHFQSRAERAEQWLARVQHEIQDKFFGANAVARPVDTRPAKPQTPERTTSTR